MGENKKIFVLGDIHGAYKALLQCLERSNFNKEEDTLIQLGDICDGWSEVYECVEELLTIKNLIAIKGNHDDWFNSWIRTSVHPTKWLQGGEGTLKSYCNNLDKKFVTIDKGYMTNMIVEDLPISHIEFFRKQHKYYKDDFGRLFVHGGFNRHDLLIDQQYDYIFWWDRDLWYQALSAGGLGQKLKIKEPVEEIFIGHTATTSWKKDTPMQASIVYNLDTGAGFGAGKLTIMDINSKKIWQSDPVNSLYPEEKGRN